MSDLNETLRRDPPKDLDAERNLLGALMQDGTLLSAITEAMGTLNEEEFASDRNRIIYGTIIKRSATTEDFNPTAICAQLETDGNLQRAGGRSYIDTLITNSGAPTATVVEFAQIIRNNYRRRAMIAVGEHILDLCYTPEGRNVKEIFDEASGEVFKLIESAQNSREGLIPVVPKAVEMIASIQQDLKLNGMMTGIMTGFTELDTITQGLQPGSLNIIAARPAVGKTSFAMNIVTNVAMNPNIHKPVLVFSLEMPMEQLILRMLSAFGRISVNKIKSGELQPNQWVDMVRKVKLLAEFKNGKEIDKLYIDDSGDITPLELRAKARKVAMDHDGLSMIMIDYVQLMRSQTKAANRTLEIGDISRSLKLLAKELNVPIIALAQLNREVDNRKDHRPLNSDLRESGSLEQDADLILFLHREAVYGQAPGGSDNSHQAQLIIGKNRNGATDDIELYFMGEYTSFFDKGYAASFGTPMNNVMTVQV